MIKKKKNSNLDRDPLTVLKIAESKALAWESAQLEENTGNVNMSPPTAIMEGYLDYRCFIDGSWKEKDMY